MVVFIVSVVTAEVTSPGVPSVAFFFMDVPSAIRAIRKSALAIFRFGRPACGDNPNLRSVGRAASIRLGLVQWNRILARGTDAPEQNLGLVNPKPVRRGRFQTGATPDDTVHVLDPTALPTNQMMVVVADPRFIERGGVRRFDAPQQSRLQQGVKIIINGLPGKAAKAFTGNDGNGIGIEMPTAMDRRQYGETGRRNAHPHRP
jgi:hypothetical protein